MHAFKYVLCSVVQILILVQGVRCNLYWEKIVDSLSYQLSDKPAPRRDAAIAHDTQRNRIVIFGGRQTINNHLQSVLMPVLFDDTWEFSFDTSNRHFLRKPRSVVKIDHLKWSQFFSSFKYWKCISEFNRPSKRLQTW